MTDGERERFDLLMEDAIASLPPRIHALLDEVPVVVLDRPTPEMVMQLRTDGLLGPDEDGVDLCGLHTGVGRTERSIEHAADWGGAMENIHLFREGIIAVAGGWEPIAEGREPEAGCGYGGEDEVYEEIRITLLHEIGHHFGLDEDDLEGLGYA